MWIIWFCSHMHTHTHTHTLSVLHACRSSLTDMTEYLVKDCTNTLSSPQQWWKYQITVVIICAIQEAHTQNAIFCGILCTTAVAEMALFMAQIPLFRVKTSKWRSVSSFHINISISLHRFHPYQKVWRAALVSLPLAEDQIIQFGLLYLSQSAEKFRRLVDHFFLLHPPLKIKTSSYQL